MTRRRLFEFSKRKFVGNLTVLSQLKTFQIVVHS